MWAWEQAISNEARTCCRVFLPMSSWTSLPTGHSEWRRRICSIGSVPAIIDSLYTACPCRNLCLSACGPCHILLEYIINWEDYVQCRGVLTLLTLSHFPCTVVFLRLPGRWRQGDSDMAYLHYRICFVCCPSLSYGFQRLSSGCCLSGFEDNWQWSWCPCPFTDCCSSWGQRYWHFGGCSWLQLWPCHFHSRVPWVF